MYHDYASNMSLPTEEQVLWSELSNMGACFSGFWGRKLLLPPPTPPDTVCPNGRRQAQSVGMNQWFWGWRLGGATWAGPRGQPGAPRSRGGGASARSAGPGATAPPRWVTRSLVPADALRGRRVHHSAGRQRRHLLHHQQGEGEACISQTADVINGDWGLQQC